MDDGAIIIALGVGAAVAAAVGVFAHAVGYDRDRAFYPAVLTVVGALYVLFAVMAGGGLQLIPEVAFFVGFAALAAIGFRTTLWLVVAGLALHGAFDFARHYILAAPGAPEWWAAFCGAYDIVAAIGLAWLLRLRSARQRAQPNANFRNGWKADTRGVKEMLHPLSQHSKNNHCRCERPVGSPPLSDEPVHDR